PAAARAHPGGHALRPERQHTRDPPVRDGRDAASAPLSQRASVKQLILARHGEAESNLAGTVSGIPPGAGLTKLGREQGRSLETALDGRRVELGVATEFTRTQETLAIALRGRHAERIVMPELNEIRFGAFDGGSLEAYRAWAWTEEPDVRPPGEGESRSEVAE